jgi:hypothetical protein
MKPFASIQNFLPHRGFRTGEREKLSTAPASIDRAALVVLNAGYLANSHFCLIFLEKKQ